MFLSHPSIPLKPLEETPLKSVSTRAQLDAFVDTLRESKGIAIDLECHSDRIQWLHMSHAYWYSRRGLDSGLV
jgi:hypothetical protein